MATRTLLGFDDDTEAEDVALQPGIHRLRHLLCRRAASTIACRRCRQFETLDVPYLGTVILDLAGCRSPTPIASASG